MDTRMLEIEKWKNYLLNKDNEDKKDMNHAFIAYHWKKKKKKKNEKNYHVPPKKILVNMRMK